MPYPSYCNSADSSALVVFSGGQDSTTCLAWALSHFERVETIGFSYGQRHAVERECREPHLDGSIGDCIKRRNRRHALACSNKVNLKSTTAHHIDALDDPVRGDSEAGAALWPRGDHAPAEGLRANESRGGES